MRSKNENESFCDCKQGDSAKVGPIQSRLRSWCIATLLLVGACGGGGGGGGGGNDAAQNTAPVANPGNAQNTDPVASPENAQNTAPVANPGNAQNVAAGALVTLSGSASSDANGDPLSYSWTLASRPSGSAASLSAANTVSPTFKPDVAGSYGINLVVNDGKADSAVSTVTVTASVSPSASTSAEGAYSGTITGGISTAFLALILENGDGWSIYGTRDGGVLKVVDFSQGSGVISNRNYASTSALDFGYSPPRSASFNATVSSEGGIQGTFTDAGLSGTIDGTAVSNSIYDYAAPANLGDVQGTWNLILSGGGAGTITIASTGSFTGTSEGCNYSGTMTPRPSGKNVFNINAVFATAAGCPYPGQSVSGIALSVLLPSGGRQLIVAAISADRSNGFSAYAFGASGVNISESELYAEVSSRVAGTNDYRNAIDYIGRTVRVGDSIVDDAGTKRQIIDVDLDVGGNFVIGDGMCPTNPCSVHDLYWYNRGIRVMSLHLATGG